MVDLIPPSELINKIRYFNENSEKELCVIFGAGASHGSFSDIRIGAPIVSKLFDLNNFNVRDAIENHPHINRLREHIVLSLHRFKNNLENYLSDLYRKDSDDKIFSSLILYLQEVYYLSSNKTPNNNYMNFVNIIKNLRGKKPWTIITFNYDTLLENSIRELTYPIRSFDEIKDYYNVINPKIIKMHGGVNFRYVFDYKYSENENSLSENEIFKMMMNDTDALKKIQLRSLKYKLPPLATENVGEKEEYYTYNFPLMMIPIHSPISIGNSFFKSQLNLAGKELSNAGMIISIGYNFGDEMFLNELKKINLQNCPLILVGSDSLIVKKENHVSYQIIKKIWPKNNIHIFGVSGFGNFISHLYQ